MVSRDLPLTFWWQERAWYLKLAQRIQRLQEVVFIKDLLKIPPIFRYPKPSTTDCAIILHTSSKNSAVEISQFSYFQSCKMRHHLHFSWLFSTFFQFFPYCLTCGGLKKRFWKRTLMCLNYTNLELTYLHMSFSGGWENVDSIPKRTRRWWAWIVHHWFGVSAFKSHWRLHAIDRRQKWQTSAQMHRKNWQCLLGKYRKGNHHQKRWLYARESFQWSLR